MAFGGILPTATKHRNASWSLRRLFRPREKVLVCLACLTFLIVCIGPIFFLPEFRGGLNNRVDNVYKVYKHMQKVGPELILPPPPLKGEEGAPLVPRGFHNVFIDGLHNVDRARLREKIESDDNLRNIIEKPMVMKQSSSPHNAPLVGQIDESANLLHNGEVGGVAVRSSGQGPVVQGGEDNDPIARQRRDKIREVGSINHIKFLMFIFNYKVCNIIFMYFKLQNYFGFQCIFNIV